MCACCLFIVRYVGEGVSRVYSIVNRGASPQSSAIRRASCASSRYFRPKDTISIHATRPASPRRARLSACIMRVRFRNSYVVLAAGCKCAFALSPPGPSSLHEASPLIVSRPLSGVTTAPLVASRCTTYGSARGRRQCVCGAPAAARVTTTAAHRTRPRRELPIWVCRRLPNG